MDSPTRVMIVEASSSERARITSELASFPEIELHFTDTGHHAIARMEFHGDIDILVTKTSDSRSEGLHLLAEARLKRPSVGRVLVSTSEDFERNQQTLLHSHEVLRSPIDGASLANFVKRYNSIGQANSVALEIDHLPSPPQHVQLLNEAISSPDMTMDSVADALETDVAVTAKLLSLVNSAYLGLPHHVASIKHSIMYLGLETTRNLVTAMELMQAAGQVADELKPYVHLINNHSMKVATHARRLAEGTQYTHDAFAAGLLHDIGLLVLLAKEPNQFRALCADPSKELEITGTTHPLLGAALLTAWGLPWQMIDAVAQSHTADQTHQPIASAAHAVFTAEQICGLIDGDVMPWEAIRMPSNDYLDAVRSREAVVELVNPRVG